MIIVYTIRSIGNYISYIQDKAGSNYYPVVHLVDASVHTVLLVQTECVWLPSDSSSPSL